MVHISVYRYNVIKRLSGLLLIRKYEMLFVTVFLILCSIPINQSIKLMIDGTFDLGPSWNFEYRLKTIPSFKPIKRTLRNPEVQHVEHKADEGKPSDDEFQINDDVINKSDADATHGTHQNGYVARTSLDDNEDDYKVDAKEEFEVTQLYKTVTRNREMIGRVSKIEDAADLTDFFGKIRNHTLQMLDKIRDEIQTKLIVSKIKKLENKYVEKFDTYVNETKKHYIKTNLGVKNVVLNTIDYSDKIWNRFLYRVKSEIDHSGLRGDDDIKILKNGIDNLKSNLSKDACATFNICRAGKGFTDFIQNLLTILMKGDDTKIKSAINAFGEELKIADFSKIMDSKTQRAFRDRLTVLEELTPFELRVLMMAYIIIIENRHHPFYNKNPEEPWIRPTVALYNIMEKFDENFKLSDNKSWSDNIRKNLGDWIAGEETDVVKIANDLVNHMQKDIIAKFDSETAAELKEKLKLFVLSEKLQLNFINLSYVPFQPFV